jgi:ribose 5-phosphate isomerase
VTNRPTPFKPPPPQMKKICEVVGVVEHGFFLDMTDAVIVAGKTGIEVINKK